ncbi:hypothetical protein [Rhizobium phage RHph_X2_26]|nr:hypothetical protein [Rhizobium phage RHph_X2_26]
MRAVIRKKGSLTLQLPNNLSGAAKMRKSSAFMARGETVKLLELKAMRSGFLYAVVEDDAGMRDTVAIENLHLQLEKGNSRHVTKS